MNGFIEGLIIGGYEVDVALDLPNFLRDLNGAFPVERAESLDDLIIGLLPAVELSDESLEYLMVLRVIHDVIDGIFRGAIPCGEDLGQIILVFGLAVNVGDNLLVKLVVELVQLLAFPVHYEFNIRFKI